MNALDLVVTAALLLAWAIVLMPILGFMRLRRLERRLEQLQDLTYTFTDASSRLSQGAGADDHRPEERTGAFGVVAPFVDAQRAQPTRPRRACRPPHRQTGIASRRAEPDGYRPPRPNGNRVRTRERRCGLAPAPDRSAAHSAASSARVSDTDRRMRCVHRVPPDASATDETADRTASGSRSHRARA